jgi:hypothetical protein
MGKRKMTTIRIDAELLKKAHDLGLNVSKISENALKDAIERMERPKTQTDGGKHLEKVEKRGVWDLNPRGPKDHRLSRPAPYQARATPRKVADSA